MNKENKDGLKEKFSEMPKITLIGRRELYIENFKSVITYTESVIELNCAMYLLKISGKELEIKSLSSDLAEICGVIFDIEIVN